MVPFVPAAVAAGAGLTGLVAGAPLLPVVGLGLASGVLLGAALGNLWGTANNPRGQLSGSRYPDLDDLADDKKSAYPDPGTATTYEVLVHEPYSQYRYITSATGPVFYLLGGNWPSGSNPNIVYTRQLRLRWSDPTGIDYDVLPTFFWGHNETTDISSVAALRVVSTGETQAPVPWPSAVPPAPVLPEPEPLPELEPLPAVPLPVFPTVAPTIPDSWPTSPAPAGVPTPTTPTRSAPPATLPQLPGLPSPVPVSPTVPQGTPTAPDGTLTPAPNPPVVTTPQDTHFPGGLPIPGNGPQATPEGIASELGRIEKKLAMVLNPKGTGIGDLLDQIDEYARLAARVWEALSSLTAGGSYPLSSPCVLDENGERVVSEVEYGGALGAFGVLSNKIDALAELLQVHKDLKQPICRQTPAVGQPVQVQFVQIE